jgi:hypothetical protein
MEKSPSIFHAYPDEYIHYFNESSNTGIKLNMLQNYIFIPLDIFLSKLHNNGINNKFEAWLTFLGCDEPAQIINLITKYPIFKPMYSQLYDFCLNIEGVMNMYSKELQIMDRNTVKYMIDEYQEQVDQLKEEKSSLTQQLDITSKQLYDANNLLAKYKEKYGDV